MLNSLRVTLITLILTMTALAPGACGVSPEVARKVSTEQVAVQTKFAETLKGYFHTMESYMDAQLGITIANSDDYTAEIQASFSRTLVLKLVDPTLTPEQREAITQSVMKEMSDDVAENELGKRRIAELVVGVKEAHVQILNNYDAILQAQKTLDQYIQLKRVDELLVERTLDTIRQKTGNITTYFGKAQELLDRIRGLVPKSILPTPKGATP